jgi:hypothetical protein
MDKNFAVDTNVMRAWAERCASYKRSTRWLWPLSLTATVSPIVLIVLLGASYFYLAFAIFVAGLLTAGIVLSIKTPELFCPHCGERPRKSLRFDRSTPHPFAADFCEHCFYWLRESSLQRARQPRSRWRSFWGSRKAIVLRGILSGLVCCAIAWFFNMPTSFWLVAMGVPTLTTVFALRNFREVSAFEVTQHTNDVTHSNVSKRRK